MSDGSPAPRVERRTALEPQDRIEFERRYLRLRLTLLIAPLLVYAAVGPSALAIALLIAVAVVLSCGLSWFFAYRFPVMLLRVQLGLRLLDVLLLYLILYVYHSFLRNAYYDSVYILFVVAATATHGRRGTLLLSAAGGLAVLIGRLSLIWSGAFSFAVRHLTDSVFYALFFVITGLAVDFLMRKSGEVVHLRESAWRESLQQALRAAEAAQEQAEAAVRVRDDFLSAVSHDLRNPLTALNGMTQVLQRRAQAVEPPARERLLVGLASIQANTARMARLINELLDVARVQAGQPLALALEPTDLVELSRRVADEYQQTTAAHRIRVEAGVPDLTGTWDGFRLERVLGNLLSNALKYSPDGGEIILTVAEEGQEAILQVQDQGLGIPAADLPRIFERFQRAGNVGHAEGTGIGLAVVRQIVEQHGGRVTVESREGAGSTFTVRLPLHSSQSSVVSSQ